MTNKTKGFWLAILAAALVFGMMVVGCSSGGGGGGVKGTSWQRKYTSAGYADETYTIKFTTGKNMTYTHTGWSSTTKNGPKTNYNKTDNGTYVYSSEHNEGVITCSVFSGGEAVFSIEGNKLTTVSRSQSFVYTKN